MISANNNIVIPTNSSQNYYFQSKDRESGTDKNESAIKNNKELTDSEKREVQALKKMDRQVRAHEQAHLSAAGGVSHSGATFSYTRGPDGKRYAKSGEVNIDIATVDGNPRATIQKMQQVRRAALAPADPSAQDRSVAAKATREIAKASAELDKVGTAGKSRNKLDIYKSEFAESDFSKTV